MALRVWGEFRNYHRDPLKSIFQVLRSIEVYFNFFNLSDLSPIHPPIKASDDAAPLLAVGFLACCVLITLRCNTGPPP